MRRHPMYKRKMSEPGWIYILPECGVDRDLIKIGRSVNPKDRAAQFWGFIWPRPRDQYPPHLWAVEVENRQAAEHDALQAMAPLRAFEEHPGWPTGPKLRWPPTSPPTKPEDWPGYWPTGYAITWHPRHYDWYRYSPEYAAYKAMEALWHKEIYRWECETHHLKLSCLTEHFRCDTQTAVEIVSRAINAQLRAIPYE